MSSPGHRANLMDPTLRDVGFGIVNVPNYQSHGPQTIVVALYAQPADVSEVSTSAENQDGSLPNAQNINYVQSISAGKLPWNSFISGLLIGLIAMYLVIKHGHGIRKQILEGEKFIIRHPLLDATLIASAAVLYIISRSIGVIH